ncbi:MAG: ABC transporter substrate-binding protein [Coriobacteriia bacterium]|nr:ABC transporter substrate-binding protein [Actinomycetota bacterium]MDZ4166834.1 ABC transporter substrate-binding protein [Coriobacteriia bacterium]
MHLERRLIALSLALALVLAGAVAGCSKEPEAPVLDPTVAPPVIGTAGVLRVGVDLEYPPFGGADQGVDAGIDVDAAAAIAERLGLKLELVSLEAGQVASAVNDGRVDIALGATPITEAVLADISTAGSYLIDGPALFSIVESGTPAPTHALDTLGGLRVAAQKESAAFWAIEADYGEGYVTGFDTLRAAFDALVAGEVDVVAGDAAVGAYIARDFDDIRIVGQVGSATPLGVVVKKDATELEAEVRSVLDTLSAEGVLGTITRKWLGEFPTLEVAAE